MEVGTHNWDAVLPQVLADIAAATCIAIDTEFTGLTTESGLRPHNLDTIDTRYSCVRNASKFGLLQYGICPFIADPVTGAFVAKPYTFLVLPRVSPIGSDVGRSGWGGDAILALSTSAVEFLARNSLDFNAWSTRGLTFLSREAEATLRDQRRREAVAKLARSIADADADDAAGSGSGPAVAADVGATAAQRPRVVCDADPAAAATLSPGDVLVSRQADIDWLADLRADVGAWIEQQQQQQQQQQQGEEGSARAPSGDAFAHKLLPKANGFRRRVVHTWVQSELASSVVVTSRPEDQAGADDFNKVQRLTYVGRGTPGRGVWAFSEVQRVVGRVDSLVDGAVQLRRVIDAISASGAPVVGHNALLDLIHTTSKFVGEPPANVTQWAAQLAEAFPVVFDTKAVCVLPELLGVFGGGSSLGQVHETATSRSALAFVELPPAAPAPAPVPVAPAADATPVGGSESGGATPGTKRPRTEDASPAVTAEVQAPAAAPPNAGGGNGRRGGGGGGGAGRPPRAERVQFTVDVASVVDIQLAGGFTFHTCAASAAAAAVVVDTAAADAAKAAGLATTASADAAAAEGAAHDAGADAYMTGVAFLRMAALLAVGAKGAATAQASASVAAGAAAAGRPAPDAPRAPPPALSLPRIPAPELAAFLRRAAADAPPALAAAEGEAPLARVADVLFLMRISSPEHRLLRLRDARALAREGRPRAAAPEREGDASNSLLVARKAAQALGSSLVHVYGLSPAIGAEKLQRVIADALGLSNRNLIDKWKHIAMVDDNSAFVLLPSHMHVRALLAAAAAGDDDSDEAMAAAAADDDDSGMNMLGVPGVSHTLSALRTRSVEPAAATAAPPAPSGSSSGGGVWAGLPSHLAALLPSPVRLSDFRWESYAQYLERRRDVYGHECDHEAVEPAPPALLAAVAPAAAAAAAALPGAN